MGLGNGYRAFDRFQERHRWLGFSLAVLQKYSEDQGGYLAATISYYAFFSLFPLLLVLVTILGYLVGNSSSFANDVVHSVLSRFPIIGDQIKDLLLERWRAALKPGMTPPPEMSILKLHNCAYNRELVRMLTEVLGSRLVADAGEWGTYAWSEYVLSTPGARIGGGTEEIVRNTIGEKVLGLPKEPRA